MPFKTIAFCSAQQGLHANQNLLFSQKTPVMRAGTVCFSFSDVKCVKSQTYFVVFENTKGEKTSPTHGPPPQKPKLLVGQEVEH